MVLLVQAHADADGARDLGLEEEGLPGRLRQSPLRDHVGVLRGAIADDVGEVGPVEAEQGCPYLPGGGR